MRLRLTNILYASPPGPSSTDHVRPTQMVVEIKPRSRSEIGDLAIDAASLKSGADVTHARYEILEDAAPLAA